MELSVDEGALSVCDGFSVNGGASGSIGVEFSVTVVEGEVSVDVEGEVSVDVDVDGVSVGVDRVSVDGAGKLPFGIIPIISQTFRSIYLSIDKNTF